MRNIKFLFCMIIFILMSVCIFPQENNKDNIGIGISIDPNTIGHPLYYFIGTSNIIQTANTPILFYFPIKLIRNIAINHLLV